MKHLITHLIKNNLKEIVKKSFRNCHVQGLHSIMLLESPGKTIRLYYHEEKGALRYNTLSVILGQDEQCSMPLAFHPHHCNLTLHCVHGTMVNINAITVDGEAGEASDVTLSKFFYESRINGEQKEPMFKHGGIGNLRIDEVKTLTPGQAITLNANVIHTVHCIGEAAWLVYEGEEDPNYNSVAWSNADLTVVDHDIYYQPMTENQILQILMHIDLL
jgi:hypothetical protein